MIESELSLRDVSRIRTDQNGKKLLKMGAVWLLSMPEIRENERLQLADETATSWAKSSCFRRSSVCV